MTLKGTSKITSGAARRRHGVIAANYFVTFWRHLWYTMHMKMHALWRSYFGLFQNDGRPCQWYFYSINSLENYVEVVCKHNLFNEIVDVQLNIYFWNRYDCFYDIYSILHLRKSKAFVQTYILVFYTNENLLMKDKKLKWQIFSDIFIHQTFFNKYFW